MDKIKKILIVMIIIIIVIVTSIVILVKKLNSIEEEDTPEKLEFENKDTYKVEQKIIEVDNRNKYYAVDSIVRKYLYYIQEMKGIIDYQKIDDEDLKQDGINQLYNILDKQYISEMNMNKNDLQNKIKEYTDYELSINKMYVYEKSSQTELYFIYASLGSEDIKLLVKTDSVNMTFSIFLEDYINNKNYNYDMNQEDIKINDDTIFQNADNQFKYANISDEYMAKQHISVLKDKLLYNPQYVYNELMSDEYKNNRFGSLEEFIKYINNNKSELESIETKKYAVNKYDDYTEYVWQDQHGNYYIFTESAIMDFKVEFDTYTIPTTKFTEKYNSSDDSYKCQMNIDKFIRMLNRHDYKTAYKCLADSYKNNYFKTEEAFENFAKSNFFDYNKLTFKDSEQKGERLYTCEIELTDLTGEKSETKKMNIVMQLNDNLDFAMSFSM